MNEKRAEMARVAASQYGVVSAGQLAGMGLKAHQRRHLVVSGLVGRVRRGVYRVMGVPQCWEQSVLAAVLAAGPGAVASHVTAGSLWQLKHCPAGGRAAGLHVTCDRQLRLVGVTGHHRVGLGSGRRCRGVAVTGPEQTIVDLASSLSARQLGECVDDALRRRLIDLGRLRRLVEGLAGPGRRGLAVLRAVLAERRAGSDPGANDWERDMNRLWVSLGLPEAVAQFRVRANGRNYRLDLALPEWKIGIEWNGFAGHGTRSGFDRDSDRRADLAMAGWYILDFTSRSSPERIAQTVRAVIAQRQAAAHPATAARDHPKHTAG